jgi:hypothetical protein
MVKPRCADGQILRNVTPCGLYPVIKQALSRWLLEGVVSGMDALRQYLRAAVHLR